MFKIKNKIKFNHSENRMRQEGDVKSSIADFDRNKNLSYLLKERFDWMNKFIDIKRLSMGTKVRVSNSKKELSAFNSEFFTNVYIYSFYYSFLLFINLYIFKSFSENLK